MQLIRSLLVPETPAEGDALTWITDAPEVIRNARENRGSSQGEKKEVKVVLQEYKMQDKWEAVFVVKGDAFFVFSNRQR